MKKKILVIHTGGTISMIEDADTGVVIESAQNPLKLKVLKDIDEFDYIVEEPFQLPSPHITLVEMLTLKNLIEKYFSSTKITGVVITHGTDTLEETAYFLDLTIDNDTPIIVTGAMRSSNELGSDGPINFINSLRVAGNEEAVGKGVLVVMNDEIHAAKNVTKTHTSSVSTFQSPQYGPIGTITKRGVSFHNQPLDFEKYQIDNVNKSVTLLKAHAGMDASLLMTLAEMNIQGVVIEALGQGNLPPLTLPGIEKLLAKEIPIVLVSRCFNGIAEDIYGYLGGGSNLKKMGVIFSNGLNGQKARLKLLIALSHQGSVNLQEIFMK